MLNYQRAFAGLSLLTLLAACAAGSGSNSKVPAGNGKADPEKMAAEPETLAPGMIPFSCESLLHKTEEWGYKAGEKWKPDSIQKAKDVVDFFATFTLVPEVSSHELRAWGDDRPAANAAEAAAAMKKFDSIQVCDHNLALIFLDGAIKYAWPKEEREYAGKALAKFVMNQQSRTALLDTRAVSVLVLQSGREKKLIPGSAPAAAKLRKEIQATKLKLSALPEGDAVAAEKSVRAELKASETFRDQLSRQLPLP